MRRLKIDALLRNLLVNFGMLPNAVYNMTLEKNEVVKIGDRFDAEECALPVEGAEYSTSALDELIRLEGKNPKVLTLSDVKCNGEFYLFNIALRAFVSSEGKLYSPNALNADCIFSSLKDAHVAMSIYSDSKNLKTFRIYEKVECAYFNEHIPEATLIPLKHDAGVIEYNSECQLSRMATSLRAMMNESLIPKYELTRLNAEGIMKYIVMSNESLKALDSDKEAELIAEFNNVKIQASIDEAPVTFKEFRRVSI